MSEFLLALLLAYLGGVLASLTPCVYPMLPITIGAMGGSQLRTRSLGGLLLKALSYVSGMAIVYALLGVMTGLSGRIFGAGLHSAKTYLGLSIVLSLAALVMMDVLPFDPQRTLTELKRLLKLRRKAGKKKTIQLAEQTASELSFSGTFLLGASSGLIAAPCTTPILTSILAYIARTQSVFLGFSLMIAFAYGLGSLLLVVASFAGAAQLLPRSGIWMRRLKICSGALLLAFAEFLIYRAGQMS